MVVAVPTDTRRAFVLQALRFGVVGVANTLVTFVVIWAMTTGLNAPVWLASAVGYGIGMLQGFVLHRGWTFTAAARDGQMQRQAVGFIVVNLICGVFFTVSNVVLHRWMPLEYSSVLATAAAVPLSFVLNRWFVFVRSPA